MHGYTCTYIYIHTNIHTCIIIYICVYIYTQKCVCGEYRAGNYIYTKVVDIYIGRHTHINPHV